MSSTWRIAAVCLTAIAGSLWAAPTVHIGEHLVVAEGETYRIEFSRDAGEFALFAKDADGNSQALVRDEGERFWYGLNAKGAELRTSLHRPEFTITARGDTTVIHVACPVSDTPSVAHNAAYALMDRWVLCRSQLVCAEAPEGAGILRIGPRCDASTERFTHYAFRGRKGEPHRGAIADLGKTGNYIGVRAWGTKGDRARDLSADMPYLSLHNPTNGAHIAFVYPMHSRFWADKGIFLQVNHEGCNYLYTGLGDKGTFGGEYPFLIYADSTGGVAALEEALPEIIAEASRLIDEGVVPIRALSMAKRVGAELEALLPQIETAWQELSSEERTPDISRRLWLSRYLWRQASRALGSNRFDDSRRFAQDAVRMAHRPE